MHKQKARIPGYFATASGRKLVFYAAGATTIGLFIGNFVPQTFGLSHYRDFMQCYKEGIPRPVSEQVLARLEKAYERLEVKPFERQLIKPFSVFGFDLFQAGSTKYRFGGILGIPINYTYSDMSEINRSEIYFRDQSIDWNSESGKLLEQAIVLTEDEQIFGLCKTILQLQTHRLLLNSIFPCVSFLMVYSIGSYLNQRLLLLTLPFPVRLIMYTILSSFGFGSWSFMKDYNQVSYDADIDKKLSSLGSQFVQAGITYYDKNLKKNMALRNLLGDDTYTAKGNVNYFIRQKTMPLTIRKSFFEEKWKELSESTQQANPQVIQ